MSSSCALPHALRANLGALFQISAAILEGSILCSHGNHLWKQHFCWLGRGSGAEVGAARGETPKFWEGSIPSLWVPLPPLAQERREVSLSPLHPTQLDNLWAVAAAHCHFVCNLPLNIAVLQGRKANSCPLMLGLSVSPAWLLFHPFPSHIPHTPCLSGKGQW